MKRRLRRMGFGSSAVLLLLTVLVTHSSPKLQTTAQAAVQDAARARVIVDEYCVTCHNQRVSSGGLRLDNLDLARIGDRAEIGEKIVRKLRAGMMPPPDVKRPD